MNETWIEEPSPTEAEPRRLDWPALVSRVVWATGARLDPDLLAQVALRHAVTEPWTQALVAACAELDIEATSLRGTAGDAVRAVGPEHPVVGRAGDRWLLLVDRRGGLVEVESDAGLERLRVGQLARRIDPASLGAVEWVAIAPSIALGAGEPAADTTAPPTPMQRLRRLMKQERHDLAVVLVYAIGVGLLTLATPIAVQALVGTVAFGTLLQPLLVLAILLFAGLAFSAVLRGLSSWVVEILQRRLLWRMTAHLARRLPQVPLERFDRSHGPELLNRFFDVFTVQKAAASLLLGGLEIVLTALVGMLVLAFYHPLLLAFDVVLVAAMVGILFGLGRRATPTAVVESKKKYALAAWLEEIAGRPTAFRLDGGAELARGRSEKLAAGYLDARATHFRVVLRQIAGALALHVVASSSLLAIGGWLVIERQLTLGQLVAAELIVTAVVASFAKVGKYLESGYDLLAAIDKLGQLADLPAVERGRARQKDASSAAAVGLEKVRVERAGRVLADGVSLRVEPGERVAITGDLAQASALAEVLGGLRAPSRGRATLDAMEIVDIDRETLARRIAFVRGDEAIAGSMLENVAFGRPLDVRAIHEALFAVGLDDAIASLPAGLDTALTSAGAPLGRSELARLAIARAIAGRPALLVIDGALDLIEAADRPRVMNEIEKYGCTIVLVTDDVELARSASRVVRVEGGALEEA